MMDNPSSSDIYFEELANAIEVALPPGLPLPLIIIGCTIHPDPDGVLIVEETIPLTTEIP